MEPAVRDINVVSAEPKSALAIGVSQVEMRRRELRRCNDRQRGASSLHQAVANGG